MKSKRRKSRQKGNQQQRSPGPDSPYAEVLQEELVSPEEAARNEEFEQRLKALEKESMEKKMIVQLKKESESDVLAAPSYDQPPPLSSTLFGSDKEDGEESSSFGPSQFALGAISIALIGVFLISNGGSELGYASKRSRSDTNVASLSEEQKNELEQELEKVEKRLEQSSEDVESLESASVIKVQLGRFDEAASSLEKLVESKPDDPEAWRLLGETYTATNSDAKAIKAFTTAFEKSGKDNLEILTLLTDAQMRSGKESEAVSLVKGLRKDASDSKLTDIELGMLSAKLYAQWKGHISDSITVYEELCKEYPDDFRPFLGKGLLLRQQGRPADAERFFTQAQFLAPASSKATVDALIKSS